MKKLFFLLFTINLYFIGCSSQKIKVPQITFNDSAYIKLSVTNCLDTMHLSYKTVPMLPSRCIINEIDITHDGTYYFSHKTTKPDFIDIMFKNRFQTYVIPGDTLKIFVNFDTNIDEKEAIKIDGVFGEIYDYFSKKHESLGFWDYSKALTEYLKQSFTLEKSLSLADSLFQVEIDFINDYNSKNSLPDWFYQTRKADYKYLKSYWSFYAIAYRDFAFNEKINNPEDYYTFENISVYNPKAILSKEYYEFIGIYLIVNHDNDLEGKRRTDRAIPLFERSIPEAKKILKGEILEYFLGYRMSSLFEGSKELRDLERCDSLFNKIQDQFTHKEIIEILRQQRDNRAKYLTERSYINPIKITEFTFNKKK